jgi:hypothetical protein
MMAMGQLRYAALKGITIAQKLSTAKQPGNCERMHRFCVIARKYC